jgi:DNA-binding response OmpR family regulator
METVHATLALEGKKVLVVEQDQDTRQLLEIYLTGAGCEVVAAQNGEEGFHALETEQPDLLLAGFRGEPDDRFVPQKMAEAKHTCPIIAIGTREDRAHYRDVLNLGYDDLLTKPFKRTDLVNDLGAFLKLAKA